MWDKINTDKFKDLVLQYKIEERTIEDFWKVIKNAKLNDDDELDDLFNSINYRWLNLKIHKVSLAIIYNYSEFIEAELRIYLKDNYIGKYISVFTLTGEDADDIISFEDYTYIRGLIMEEERNEEIASLAIDENIDDEVIQRITGVSMERLNELKLEKQRNF